MIDSSRCLHNYRLSLIDWSKLTTYHLFFVENCMAILDILQYPDPRLRKQAAAINHIDQSVKILIDNMLETMYAASGIGLAATQIDQHIRLVVIDVSSEHNAPLVLVNPAFTALEGEQTYQEGCLSIPGYHEMVTRAERIAVTSLDQNGKQQDFEADGLLSVCIQHEIDHTNGKLFIDYLSPLKRQRVKKKMLKAQKINT